MAVFDYVAISEDGKRTRGVITSDSARSARKELRMQQLSPIDIREASDKPSTGPDRAGRISSSDLMVSTRQLAILIQAGSTVEEALRSVATETNKDAVKRTFLSARNAVQQGSTLSDAFGAHPNSFPNYYRSVVESGQMSGRLGEVLERLATHLEKSRKLRRKLLSALIYPAVLCVVALVVVVLLLIFVVPEVVEQFNTVGEQLPALTRAVIGLSDFFRQWWWAVIAGGLLLYLILRRVLAIATVRQSVDSVALRLPLLGKVFRTVNAARFARTFATLTGSGGTVTDGLIASAGSVSNSVFKNAIQSIRRRVEEGASLNRAIKETQLFPAMLVHMIASGEAAGDLPGMSDRAANFMEDELDNNATVALGLLEPFLIVMLAGVVALIVLAIMLPILQLNTLVVGA